MGQISVPPVSGASLLIGGITMPVATGTISEATAGFHVPLATGASLIPDTNAAFTAHGSGRGILIYTGPTRTMRMDWSCSWLRSSGGTVAHAHSSGISTAVGTIPTGSPASGAGAVTGTLWQGVFQSMAGSTFLTMVNNTYIALTFNTVFVNPTIQWQATRIVVQGLG